MTHSLKKGDQVTVTYEGRLQDGEIFDTTDDTDPLRFEVGDGSVLPAFEQAVLAMRVGEEKTIAVPAAEAFGPVQQELIMTVPRRQLGEKIEPRPGMVLAMNVEKEGQALPVPALVTKVEGDEITVDFNHPLAGKDLVYKITLIAVDEAP